MSITKENILNAVAEMNVMDICDLVKMMEEKFGVSAAPVAVTTSTNPTNETIKEEKTEFDVILTSMGSNKISVIKAVRATTGLGLKEAKSAVEGIPFTIKESASKNESEELRKQFEEAGAKVELK